MPTTIEEQREKLTRALAKQAELEAELKAKEECGRVKAQLYDAQLKQGQLQAKLDAQQDSKRILERAAQTRALADVPERTDGSNRISIFAKTHVVEAPQVLIDGKDKVEGAHRVVVEPGKVVVEDKDGTVIRVFEVQAAPVEKTDAAQLQKDVSEYVSQFGHGRRVPGRSSAGRVEAPAVGHQLQADVASFIGDKLDRARYASTRQKIDDEG